MAQISVESVSKIFALVGNETTVALQDVSLDVQKGEFLTIVGPSGCGKTTLLRILAGLESQTSGQIKIQNTDPTGPLTAMVFQEQSIFPWMTVEQNVAYGPRLRGIPPRAYQETVRYYLDKVGLTRFAHAYPRQLSGGMKQRVSVARAFANDPQILLMDEPFGSVDEQTRILLQEELLRIWEESRKTVVYVTHSIDEALVLGDRIIVISARPGHVKAEIPVNLPRPRQIQTILAALGPWQLNNVFEPGPDHIVFRLRSRQLLQPPQLTLGLFPDILGQIGLRQLLA